MSVACTKQTGFTLVELVVVIVITGILSTFLVQFILLPIQSYSDVARRTRLVDIANTVIEKIRLDVREALPNSVRVGNCGGVNNCVEFLRAPFGGRYRSEKDKTVAPNVGNPLKIGSVDNDGFDMLVPFPASEKAAIISGANLAVNCDVTPAVPVYLSVNSTMQANEDPWSFETLAKVSQISTVEDFPANFSVIEFEHGDPAATGNFKFESASPTQRFFLVDTPIKYIWDSVSNKINRYRCYAIDTATVNGTPSVTPGILAAQITNVTFSYQAGTTDLPVGLLTVSVTVKEAGGAESITLLQQIQILNMS